VKSCRERKNYWYIDLADTKFIWFFMKFDNDDDDDDNTRVSHSK